VDSDSNINHSGSPEAKLFVPNDKEKWNPPDICITFLSHFREERWLMNSEELFGFKYKWLEPSMANEEMYQDGDLFVRIAQDIARITVEALPNGYNLNKLKAIKPSQQWQVKCWGGSKIKDDIEALLSESAKMLKIKQALCKSVSTFLRERDYWDESKTRPLIKDAYVLIYEAMKRGFEQNSKWLYVDEDSWSKYGLGKPAIDACISASKRRYQRSKQY